jgi:hypothetical protein
MVEKKALLPVKKQRQEIECKKLNYLVMYAVNELY